MDSIMSLCLYLIVFGQIYNVAMSTCFDTFRASHGDNDTIYDVSLCLSKFKYSFQIQFSNPIIDSYCDRLLFMVVVYRKYRKVALPIRVAGECKMP